MRGRRRRPGARAACRPAPGCATHPARAHGRMGVEAQAHLGGGRRGSGRAVRWCRRGVRVGETAAWGETGAHLEVDPGVTQQRLGRGPPGRVTLRAAGTDLRQGGGRGSLTQDPWPLPWTQLGGVMLQPPSMFCFDCLQCLREGPWPGSPLCMWGRGRGPAAGTQPDIKLEFCYGPLLQTPNPDPPTCKHSRMNSEASGLSVSGMEGTSLLLAILKITCTCGHRPGQVLAAVLCHLKSAPNLNAMAAHACSSCSRGCALQHKQRLCSTTISISRPWIRVLG